MKEKFINFIKTYDPRTILATGAIIILALAIIIGISLRNYLSNKEELDAKNKTVLHKQIKSAKTYRDNTKSSPSSSNTTPQDVSSPASPQTSISEPSFFDGSIAKTQTTQTFSKNTSARNRKIRSKTTRYHRKRISHSYSSSASSSASANSSASSNINTTSVQTSATATTSSSSAESSATASSR